MVCCAGFTVSFTDCLVDQDPASRRLPSLRVIPDLAPPRPENATVTTWGLDTVCRICIGDGGPAGGG